MENRIKNIEDYSPMMQHYIKVKDQYKDIIIFYRLGDFYELFFEDATLCSRVLDLTLTSKACGKAGKAPMCGVPAKACDIYLKRLVSLGYKVGICEQLTEPTKGAEIVERDVVRIVTPGTIMEDEILEEKKNNFIACIYFNKEYYIGNRAISGLS